MKKHASKTLLLCTGVLIIATGIFGCKNEKKETVYEPKPEPQQKLVPQPFPTTYGFPVAEATLISYTQDYNNPKNTEGIYTHAWQIWAGLTQKTDIKMANGHEVRVFESWRTPQQIKTRSKKDLAGSNTISYLILL